MSNYANSLYRDYEKLEIKNQKVNKENKLLRLRLDILESENQRKDKIISKHEKVIEDIETNNKKIINYICKNIELIDNNNKITNNQKKMLKKIYISINEEKYLKVLMIMFAKKLINKLRSILGSFRGFLKSFLWR